MTTVGTNMTYHQYKLAKIDKVVFEVGAFETHGSHMPFEPMPLFPISFQRSWRNALKE